MSIDEKADEEVSGEVNNNNKVKEYATLLYLGEYEKAAELLQNSSKEERICLKVCDAHKYALRKIDKIVHKAVSARDKAYYEELLELFR